LKQLNTNQKSPPCKNWIAEFAELFSSQSEPKQTRIETFVLASCFLVITGAMDEKLWIGVTGCH
jgi:hypothetical protein